MKSNENCSLLVENEESIGGEQLDSVELVCLQPEMGDAESEDDNVNFKNHAFIAQPPFNKEDKEFDFKTVLFSFLFCVVSLSL